MRSSKLLCWVLAIIVVTAACGGDEPPAAPAGGMTHTPGVLTVGSDISSPPFEDFDAAGGVVGFDADLIEEIAERLGLTVEWIDTDFETIFTQLATGQFDVVASATAITPERSAQVNFTDPYYSSQQAFVVNTTLNPFIDGTEELGAGDSVAVQAGTTGATWATDNLAPDDVLVLEFEAIADAYAEAESGQVTGVIDDEPSTVAELGNREDLEIVSMINERYGFGVDPARTELLALINTAFANMLEDGTYQAIYDRWFDAPAGSVLYAASPVRFSAEPPPPEGTVGVEYFWDFCGPGEAEETQELSLIQCSPDPEATPSGGHPPYHFELDSGSGFPPIGLHLQKDGVLNGTPSAATTGASFRVCAVDLDANQACASVTIVIHGVVELELAGTWQVDTLSGVCPSAYGTWEATVTVAGDRLTGSWRDTYHGNQDYVIDTTIQDATAIWTADTGDESITLTGTFDLEAGTVEGPLVGPVCTPAAGRWIGSFEGTKVQP